MPDYASIASRCMNSIGYRENPEAAIAEACREACEALEKQLARAESFLAESQDMRDKYLSVIECANNNTRRRDERIAALEAENAALREDKARLDEYERQLPPDFDWTVTPLDFGTWKIEPIRASAKDLGWGPHYATARAAIDAARKERKG